MPPTKDRIPSLPSSHFEKPRVMPTDVDIAIVGAGAAGLAAGIFAAQTRSDLTIMLLDSARNIGAKILVSGRGRCNVTHKTVTSADFHGPPGIVKRVLQRFDERATVDWFESLDVSLKHEATGKLFPVTNKARTVLQTLLRRCDELGIHAMTQHRVKDVLPTDTGFRIVHEAGHIIAQRVIMATGGQSLPKSGSDGHGWSIAQRLGHTVSPTYQALVPLVLDDTFFHRGLSGISHEATMTTRVQGKTVDRRSGSLLWTHFGISGPVVLDASRFWVMANGKALEATVSVSFLTGESFEAVDRWLSHAANHTGGKTVASILLQRLPNRVVKALCTYIGTLHEAQSDQNAGERTSDELGSTGLSQLRRSQRRAITQVLTDLPLPVVRARGWNYAEVTAGGIPLQEVNPQSMVSRKVPGL